MIYRKPKRFFEDSGTVNPEEAYYVPLDNVYNTKKQDIKTMVDRGRYFSIFAPITFIKPGILKRFLKRSKHTGKNLATEDFAEGYLVVFDTRIPVGAGCKPQVHQVGDYTVTSFIISIGRPK